MQKQSRVQKYEGLREQIKEEVPLNRTVDRQQDVEEDNFLDFIPETKKNIDDTLSVPLTYDMIDDRNDSVNEALNQAKARVGKSHYDTRQHILKKIKSEDEEKMAQDVTQEDVVQPKKSFMEKLAAMSPDEDVEEYHKYETEVLSIEDMHDEEDEEEELTRFEIVMNYIILGLIGIFFIILLFIIKQLLF